jgi:hypothetical protein
MSPEIETLDHLLGGDLFLTIARTLYSDADAFIKSLQALLSDGDVRLYSIAGSEVPDWQWRELFRDKSVFDNLATLKLKITQQGVDKVA